MINKSDLMKRFYVIVLMFVGITSFAQEANILEEFKALSKHYAQLDAFSMDISIQYLGENGDQLVVQNGNVLHSSELHYMEMAGHITLITNNTYLSVDNDYKTLVFNAYEKVKKKKPVESDIDISAVLDSIWAHQGNLNYKRIQSKPGTLRVFIEDEENEHYDSYEMTIDTKKNQLLEIVYYFKPEDEEKYVQQVRIQYSNETNRPKLNQDKLKVDNYVLKKKDNYSPVERYKHYQFIDQTKQP